jgi:MFS family permease
LESAQAAFWAGWVFIGLGLGSPLMGWMSTRFASRRQLMFISSLIALGSISWIVYAPPRLEMVAALLFIFGFTTGSFVLGFSLGKDLNDSSASGSIVSLINTGDVVISALSAPLIGKLLDWSGKSVVISGVVYFSDYKWALSLLPIYHLIALGLLWFIKEPTQKVYKASR